VKVEGNWGAVTKAKGPQPQTRRTVHNIMFHCITSKLLWPPYIIGQAIIFLPCGFFLSFFFFFPRLISATVDWMSSILPHMVWP